jgi:hypothetical protein
MENQINQDDKTYVVADVMLPDANWELVNSGLMDLSDIEKKIVTDEYGINPIVICKKSTYTLAHKKAQQRYREKYPEKYNDAQRKLYEDKKKDDEWKQKFNERSRMNNQKYREKKKNEIIESGGVVKGKGRPRKIKPEIIDVPIMNIDEIELNPTVLTDTKEEIVMITEPKVKAKRKYVKKVKETPENNI